MPIHIKIKKRIKYYIKAINDLIYNGIMKK